MEDMEDEDDLEPIFGGPRVVHNRWFSKDRGQFFVMIYGMFTDRRGEESYINDFIPYAQYVLYKEKGIIAKPWEYIYHLNRNWKDDRIENLKVINIHPIPIEVKYPYDPEKYYATRNWDKLKRKYYVRLHLKKEYRNDKFLKKDIKKPIHIYIAETKKLKRFLNDDEKVIYIDRDKLNYSKDNLQVVEKGKRGFNSFPIGEVPFQDYYIGPEIVRNKKIFIKLFYINDLYKNTAIIRSRYRYELKLGRRLKDNELLVYKDGNPLNDDIDNLTHKTYPQAEYPFEDYFIGRIDVNKKNERKHIHLKHKTNSKKNTYIPYARYRKQIIEGRIFSKDEDIDVDHVDGNKFNDSDDNLQILTKEEHRKKSIQEQKDMAPEVVICCDGCENDFITTLCYIKRRLNREANKSNNLFCSRDCFNKNKDKLKYKKLIKHICTGTGKEIWIPENVRFLPSRFNPNALPFYTWDAVSKWRYKERSESQ